MRQSSSFTRATTNSCVSGIEVLKLSTSQTSSNRRHALTQDMGNSMSASTLRRSKTRWTANSSSSSFPNQNLVTVVTRPVMTKKTIGDLEAVRTLNARRINVESRKGREGVADRKPWQERLEQVLLMPLRYVPYVGP